MVGQVFTVEPWQYGFFSMEGAILKALVWVCLPWLPMELWGEAAIRSILNLADELVLVDKCTVES